MDMRTIMGAVWRQRVVALLILLATAAATVAGLYYAPRSYTAEATISAATRPDTGIAESDLESLRATLGEIADSTELIEVVQDGLSVERTEEQLKRGVTAQWIQGTILVKIEVTDRNPQVAAEIANSVAAILPTLDPSGGAFEFGTSDAAEAPDSFSSPNVPLVAGVALLLGLGLAGTAAVLRDRRHRRVTGGPALAAALEAPVLATISPPRVATSLPALYPGTAAADVFRSLRIALEARAAEDPVRKLVVAGSEPGDVNVWLGANLAIALAQVERNVLLIDGRLGQTGGRSIEAPPDTPGLIDVLQGESLLAAVSKGPVERLSVLPPGSAANVSHERLIESRFAEVAKEATEAFDVVVVLAPALSEGQDAVLMAVDGSLLLAVPAHRTVVSKVRADALHMRAVGVRLIGTVLIRRRGRRGRG